MADSARDKIANIIAECGKDDCAPLQEADRILNIVREEIDAAIANLSDRLCGVEELLGL